MVWPSTDYLRSWTLWVVEPGSKPEELLGSYGILLTELTTLYIRRLGHVTAYTSQLSKTKVLFVRSLYIRGNYGRRKVVTCSQRQKWVPGWSKVLGKGMFLTPHKAPEIC